MPRIAEPTPEAIARAADRLARGGVVAFPTETVYGLGACTFERGALDAVFELKGRPAHNPLIAHVLGADDARRVAAAWDERCADLAARFWPGPLTLIVPRAPAVPERATAGLATIAVRAPRHPVARRLLEALGQPISAPSANRSGRVSPTTARHVAEEFADEADLMILDGGACEVGLESTVLDLTVDPPAILRPGSVTEPELAAVVGRVARPRVTAQAASPGTSPRHYAPRTPAELVPSRDLPGRLASARPCAVLCFDAASIPRPHVAVEMPQGAGAYARGLYEALRRADAMNVDRILVEEPPTTNEIWKAVHDRLRRATERPE